MWVVASILVATRAFLLIRAEGDLLTVFVPSDEDYQ